MPSLKTGGKKININEALQKGSKEPGVHTSVTFPASIHKELHIRSSLSGKSMSCILTEALEAKFAAEPREQI